MAPGDTLDLTIWIESAPPAFGIALELRVPESLQFLECMPGEFFGTEQLSICQPQTGGVGLSWTRLRGSSPVEGFGVLGRIRARVVESGSHAIALGRAPEVLEESGAPLAVPEFFGSLILTDSTFAAIPRGDLSGSAMHRAEEAERGVFCP
jgi:hypothetical protein